MQNYHFSGEEQMPSPQLIYDLDGIRRNTERAIREAGGADRLWPHVKTHKMADMIRLQLSYGIRRFKCATPAEAEMAAANGAEAVLLAYPLVGPNISRFHRLAAAFPNVRFYAIGDHLDSLNALAAAGGADVLIDVDPGFHRTGVPIRSLEAFCRKASAISGLRLAGFHLYDGQNHQQDPGERRKAVCALEESFRPIYHRLTTDGICGPTAVFGGTPSMPVFAALLSLYQDAWLSPGTLFVGDAGYSEGFPDMDYPPAAYILARVISTPQPDCFTLDLGYKAISSDQKVPGIPVGIAAELWFQSEEHWTFRMKPGFEDTCPSVGDIVYVIPSHICPTTALYEQVPVISGGRIVDVWPVTARGRKLSFESLQMSETAL